jgi:hypothetical protein
MTMDFEGSQFERELILWRARWYLYSDDKVRRLLRAALETSCCYELGEL